MLKVAVLRGGPSHGYSDSLKTGGYIISNLRDMGEKYEPVDIFISKEGEWHREGIVQDPHVLLNDIDLVWNALHGLYSKDMQVERVMEGLSIPFVGSSSVASALSRNRDTAKELYLRHGLPTLRYEVISKDVLNEEVLLNIFRNYLHPVSVKPVNVYGSVGSSLAYTFNELRDAVNIALAYSPRAIVEELIKGTEFNCSVIEGGRGEKLYALLPVNADDIKLRAEKNREIEDIAKSAHEALGLSHYSSSNFVVTPKKKVYIVETNSHPPVYEGSHFHKSLLSTGWKPQDFMGHVLSIAI